MTEPTTAMSDLHDLARRLDGLDGSGYKHYKRIKGSYDAGRFRLSLEYVQGDPYAPPSRLRVRIDAAAAELPDWALSGPARRRAAADFLNRALAGALGERSRSRGSGKSGVLRVLRPGQQILDRTSVLLSGDGAIEARFGAGLPARGRRIRGSQAAELLTDDVVAAVERALFFDAIDGGALRTHVQTAEDASALRRQLDARELVAFVADGALLPRRSGVDDRPLPAAEAVPFRSPEGLRVTLDAPNAGPVAGMGVPAGITLIVGGGYHGKSTLLEALERGVYDHIPGDGRERVVMIRDAVKVRAEDGRGVAGADIANFIAGLPGGEDTRHFETDDASGSTSQAAAIVEALEVGARCLLLDEDTSATNFMIRDARMQELIADEFEPITPFIDRARQLASEHGVSTVLVVGGAGDYFDIADTVIAMRGYRPEEATVRAHEIAEAQPSARRREGGPWRPTRPRRPLPDSIDPSRGKRDVSVKIRARDRVLFGSEEIDIGAVEQVVERAQTRAMANALVWARNGAIDGENTMREALEATMAAIRDGGLDVVQPYETGDLSAFRIYELAAMLGRLRTVETR